MQKPIIAIDMDDVLVDSTENIRELANQHLGIDLQIHHYRIPGEYWGYPEAVWASQGYSGMLTLAELDRDMHLDQSRLRPMADAEKVLITLSEIYEFVIVSARPMSWYDASITWLETHYPGVFSRVVFADGYEGLKQKHKGAICKELGASWLIDDSIDHAQTALAEGLGAVLYGEYGWHYKGMPDGVIGCKNWKEVEAYFSGTK